MIDWNIRARAHSCLNCRHDFTDGEKCHSIVVDKNITEIPQNIMERLPANQPQIQTVGITATASEYARIDLCENCRQQLLLNDVTSSWQSIYTPPPPPAPEPLPRETAESLMKKLLEEESNREVNSVIFILAIMLERKKILIEHSVKHSDDGTLLRVYEHKKNGDVLLIVDPELHPDEVPYIQQRITELLAPNKS